MILRTKRLICLLIAIASVLTIVGSVSYAYFTAIGDTRKVSATINTGKTMVTFSDNDLGLSAKLGFGESVTKKFTIENKGTTDAIVKLFFDKIINTYIEGSLTYTLSYSETEDGTYTEVVSKTNVPQSENVSKKILANSITIPVGKTYYYNLEITLNYLSDVNQDADINATFNTKFAAEDINFKNTIEKIIATSQGVKSVFDEPATTDEGVFEMEDDYGTSYYYRGAVENNFLQFAGFYWRIIRINGDGSLRIIYDGTQAYANGTNNANRFIKTGQAYNTNYNDAKYVGWMYGPAGTALSTSKEEAQTNTVDSEIKKVVDEWYKINIEDAGYGSVVSDTLFCNDRSTPGKTTTLWISDTGLGYGVEVTAYGALGRFMTGNNSTSLSAKTEIQPTFKCPQKNDAFTANDTNIGNGALTYPVGLITADEIVAAGSGKYGTRNSKYYLYNPSSFNWSLSPRYFGGVRSDVFYVNTLGGLSYADVSAASGAVAPVINLTYDYVITLIGNGTMENPYRAE